MGARNDIDGPSAAGDFEPEGCPQCGCHEYEHDGNAVKCMNCGHADNLAWGTRAENAADRTAHGRAARITPEKRARMLAGLKRWREARNVGA